VRREVAVCEKSSVERNVERCCISKKVDAAEATLETREWLPVLFRRRRTPEMMDTSFEEVLEKASRVTHYTSHVIGYLRLVFYHASGSLYIAP
jgi:hypothetical protein